MEETPQPALEQLHEQHKELIEEMLEGFETWWEGICWFHDVQTYSLGMFPNEPMRNVLGCPLSFDFQIIFNHKTEPGHPVRHQFVTKHVQPAFDKSIKWFWSDVTEYGSGGPSTDTESLIALRPSIQHLHDEQRDVLKRMAEGFDSTAAGQRWVRDLARATLGENSGKYEHDVSKPMLIDGVLRPQKPDAEKWQTARLRAIGRDILPWCAAAMRKQAKAAKEQPETKEREVPEYELGADDLVDNTRDGRG